MALYIIIYVNWIYLTERACIVDFSERMWSFIERVFSCERCGQCCRNIQWIDELSQFDRGNGSCIHLERNHCAIYDERPEICRVDVMYEKRYYQNFTQEQFYRLNKEVCKKLRLQVNKK